MRSVAAAVQPISTLRVPSRSFDRQTVTVRGVVRVPVVSASTPTSLSRYLDARRSATATRWSRSFHCRYEGSTVAEGKAVPPSRGVISNEEEHRNMTSRTPRRHRRLALMAAGTAAAMVLLPGAASAQVVHSVQKIVGTSAQPVVPSPSAPGTPSTPQITEPGPGAGGGAGTPSAPNTGDLPIVGDVLGGNSHTTGLLGGDHHDGHDGDHHDGDHHGDVEHRDDTSGSHEIDDPEPPD